MQLQKCLKEKVFSVGDKIYGDKFRTVTNSEKCTGFGELLIEAVMRLAFFCKRGGMLKPRFGFEKASLKTWQRTWNLGD